MADRWLTYQQAGEALGLSAEAVRQRALRLRWRRQRGNDGRALIMVPEDASEHIRPRTPVQKAVQTAVQTPGQTADTKALAEAVAAFREAEDKLRAERDAALALVAAERSRADRAEGEAAALREAVRVAEAATERLDRLLEKQLAGRRPWWSRFSAWRDR